MARKKGPKVQQAYDHIKKKILSFELAPGMMVSDIAIEKELNMSRYPVRVAVLMLISDGLVESTLVGARVASMTLEDIVEICQVRRVVEVASINILMEKGGMTEEQKQNISEIFRQMQSNPNPVKNYQFDDLFHNAIVVAAGNKRLVEISDKMRLQISRARWLNLVLPHRMAVATEEHDRILQALIQGDHDDCVSNMEIHLNRSEQNFKNVLSSPKYNPQFMTAMSFISRLNSNSDSDSDSDSVNKVT